VLDAAAGPDAPAIGSAHASGKSDGGEKSKSQDQSKPADAIVQVALADPDKAGTASTRTTEDADAVTASDAAPVSPVEIALLAQAVPAEAGSGSPPASSGKPRNVDTGADGGAKPVQKSDMGDDATSPVANPAVAMTLADASVVAVAVAVAPAPATPSPAVQTDVQITGKASSASSIDTANGPAQLAAASVGATLPASDGESTPKEVDPAAAPESAETTGTSPKAATGQISNAALASADVKAALATGKSDKPAKSGETEAGSAQAEATPLPPREQKVEDPGTGRNKAADDKDGKTQTGNVKESPSATAKPMQPHALSAHVEAEAHPAEDDSNSKAPAAHEPHGQPSEHASAAARVAFTAAHSNISAPATAAQAVTAQLGVAPSPLGLTVAAPLAAPMQVIWQPTPERADTIDKAVPISGIAIEIVSRAEDGLRRFEIRLDPPELGRIDVRLDVDNGGNVTSRLTADRPETLDLLRRDAPQLERALQHAGLNTEGGLQFSLRDQNFGSRDQARQQNTPTFIVPDDEPAAAEAARRGYGRLIGLGSGVDIRV